MSTPEFCVKNMRLRNVIAIFPTKEEAVKESKRLNRLYQTNEYWPLEWTVPA
tara:strand:- start:2494 stop:2649 length:156 start_codon:yes stop_codon:yes gene_type:complete